MNAQLKPAVQTIKDFLVAQFGKSAEAIEGVNSDFVGGSECHQPHFVTDDDGKLFVHCGGRVIMGFVPHPGFQGSVYLVFDDADERRWQWQRAQGKELNEIGPCPRSGLRLVYSI
jgi:hypothetical protein